MNDAPGSIVDEILRLAGSRPCIAIVEDSHRIDLRWARSTVTTNGDSLSRDVTVIALDPRGAGTAVAPLGSSRPDRYELGLLVDRAFAAAHESGPADDAAPLMGAEGSPAGLDRWGDGAEGARTGSIGPLVTGLGAAFEEAAASEVELFGYAEQTTTTTCLGTTTGLRFRHVQPQARVEMTAKSHGRSRSSWWGRAADSLPAIDIAPALGELRAGLDAQGREVPVEPGRHEVILAPGAVGDLMVDLWWSATARDALDGHSVFSAPGGGTRIGETLTQRDLTLVSDPAREGIAAAGRLVAGSSSAHASVFDNGAVLGPVPWIAHGRLANLMAPRALAGTHGLPFVASADTIALDDAEGHGSLADLIARTSSALLVTCVWYTRLVDPRTLLLTGLTRDGVYVVRDGEIVGAAGNFRFNDSPVAMLGRVADASATGRTLPREMGDYAPRVAMPALRVHEVNMSTRSEAQ